MKENCEAFIKYVNTYDLTNPKIKQRFKHSLRVKNISMKLAKSLNLSKEEVYVATLIGLIHDTARFYQITKYDTISDKKSIDHGDFGVKMLFTDNLIKNYNVDEKYYKDISLAIKNHNKHILNYDTNFCKIIRDADKLDILYLLGTDKNELNFDIEPVSDEVKACFYKKHDIEFKDIKTTGDKVLIYLGYVFDINYKFSFKYIKDHHLYEKIYQKLKNNYLLKEYFDYVDNYITERI